MRTNIVVVPHEIGEELGGVHVVLMRSDASDHVPAPSGKMM
jgi:hypothetical protein